MIYVLILILIAWGLLVALFEYLFGLSQDASAAIAASILGAGFLIFIWFCCFSRRGRVIARARNIARIRCRRLMIEYHEEWEERNKKFCQQRDKEISRDVDRGMSPSKYIPGISCGASTARAKYDGWE